MFLIRFWGEWHKGIARYTQIGRFLSQIPLMCSVRPWDPTSLLSSQWPLGCTWNSAVINIGWIRLRFSVFITLFHKQANICCSIGNISRSIFSLDHNATDQAIVISKYQSYFTKHDNFFSGKQQGAVRTDQKLYFLLIYDFWNAVRIFKIATSLSIFSTTRLFLTQQRKTNEK